ncbi:MAG: methylated-DNA--[protein]-cysteine S-methyltransferase [Actinomycetota bacterium]
MRTWTEISSPIGPLTCVVENGLLIRVAMKDQAHLPDPSTFGDPGGLDPQIEQQLREYFAGGRTVFDLPLAPSGTDFQREVWSSLEEIPYGTTTTYGALAEKIGRPRAVRALGLAVGRNPLSVIVPCHRVLGAGGSLTGYAGGLDRKRWLLNLEQPEIDWATR